ncbi:MAG TPA: TetR/AcrR family transcriptional regulator [Aggregatilineales bacterium]|nr:TetR/AcrR family transcriptional regulator [Chloroflexota bacterium]HOA23695.1 TetR/AcrR family transcriptional regulator [Aggregatilineales bacterium]HPV05737.1 TetR/AcrR family transcriptional regulator [Aggregatilineales bacterium]HQA66893.1 TetR/AcrR family transcriptional regulator [Aggregatilineales bacterium]HQE17348.1 TetR/AcrR family transcriptional regulator [Aggregatilineales bacterium]
MPIDEKRRSRGERTRQAILDAAEKLFLNNGYNGTSMRQIARGARIALGGIYNHFGSKEEIFRTLLDERIPYAAIADMLADIETTSGPQMLYEAFERLMTLTTEQSDNLGLLVIDMREFGGSTVREQSAAIIPALLAFTGRVQAAGGLRPGIDGIVILRLLLSLVIGHTILDLILSGGDLPLLPDMPSSREVLDGMQDILQRGIRASVKED